MEGGSLIVILTGPAASGKTTLVSRFASDESAFLSVNAVPITNTAISLQREDTSGQESFRPILATYYDLANCCVLVFDVTDAASFENVKDRRDEFVVIGNPPDAKRFPFILVGNKANKAGDRQVSWNEAQAWALSRRMVYIETSAVEEWNVKVLFELAGRLALITLGIVVFSHVRTVHCCNNSRKQGAVKVMLFGPAECGKTDRVAQYKPRLSEPSFRHVNINRDQSHIPANLGHSWTNRLQTCPLGLLLVFDIANAASVMEVEG